MLPRKSASILVLPFEEFSIWPELSSFKFQNPGGVVWALRTEEDGGGRKSLFLILDG